MQPSEFEYGGMNDFAQCLKWQQDDLIEEFLKSVNYYVIVNSFCCFGGDTNETG